MKYSFFSLISIAFFFSCISNSFSQERVITGLVTTFQKIAVTNAEVKVFSSKAIVLTDSVGKFEVRCMDNDKIKVSAKGFKSQSLKIDEDTKEAVVDLTFNANEKKIDQAIGYGYIKEEDRSYAISSAVNANNDFLKYSSMIDVIINSSPSVTYDGAGFIIRGGSSLLSSNYAMIVIEGRQANISQLKMLSPMDVESVDILKGSASSIYGSRGANGVIIVNIKTGATEN